MYRTVFLSAVRHETVKRAIRSCPLTQRVVDQFVAGPTWAKARDTVAPLLDKGFLATVDCLAPATRTLADGEQALATYLGVLDQIDALGWADRVELSVNLTALGLFVRDGEQATQHALTLAAKAHTIGARLTIDTGSPTTMTKTLRVFARLKEQYADVGCALPANLKRAESECRGLDAPGNRIRLYKGPYATPLSLAFADRHDVDLSYVRCLKMLMEGEGTPLVATHDPVMIEIAQELAAHTNRGLKDFEFQLLYGVRPIEQERLIDLGHTVRLYVPFGPNWYDYVMNRLAGHPSNLLLFLKCR